MRIGRHAAVSDTGRRRLQNEDAHVDEPPLFAVADGMGGAQAGELASRLAASTLEGWSANQQGEVALELLVRDANNRIFERSLTDPAASGMGTTVTAALVDERGETVAIGHVGDSRAYRVRDGRLEQLTADHSLVAELLRSGRLTQEEAEAHPHRSVITRALGTDAEVDVDTITVALQPDDLFLLCSDGLTTMVRDEDILAIVAAAAHDPARAAEMLVKAANEAGGEDNITAVLFEVVAGEPEAHRDRAQALAAVPGPDGRGEPPQESLPPARVRRWGAAAGSRWPALLLLASLFGAGALVVIWSLTR